MISSREHDPIIVWALSGIIATVAFADGYSIILKILGAEEFYAWNLAADFIIQGRQAITSFYGVAIGLAADYFLGALNGILIGLLLEWRGSTYYWFKGMGVTFSNWIALGIMTQVVPNLFTYRLTPLNFFTFFIGYGLIGVATAYMILTWRQRKFKK